MCKRTDITNQMATGKYPHHNGGSLSANAPMGSTRRGWAFYLAAFASVLLCLTGCQSARAPGSSSLAAVMIYGGDVHAIQEATLKVFEMNDYTTLRSDDIKLVFEREGTKWDSRMYGSWGEGNLWIKVEVKIQPYGNDHLLRCDVFAVRNHGDSFFSETQKIRPISSGPYKKMLEEIKGRVGTGGAVTPSS